MNWPSADQSTTTPEATLTIGRQLATHVENRDRTWPPGNHQIDIGYARELISRRRRVAMEAGGAFKRAALERLLNQPGCVGMRIYYGIHADGRPALVLVGVDEHGEELIRGALLEDHYPCPPFCPIGPSLRSSRD